MRILILFIFLSFSMISSHAQGSISALRVEIFESDDSSDLNVVHYFHNAIVTTHFKKKYVFHSLFTTFEPDEQEYYHLSTGQRYKTTKITNALDHYMFVYDFPPNGWLTIYFTPTKDNSFSAAYTESSISSSTDYD